MLKLVKQHVGPVFCPTTYRGDPFSQFVKKVVKNCFLVSSVHKGSKPRVTCVLQSDHFSGIVVTYWHRLLNMIPICAENVEKIAKTCHTKRCAKSLFFVIFPSNPGTLAERWGQIATNHNNLC